MLIVNYHTGAPSLALEQYRALNLKQVQTDTLSHLVLSRASSFALASLGDLTYSNECMEASQIYVSNASDVCSHVYLALENNPHVTFRHQSSLSALSCKKSTHRQVLMRRGHFSVLKFLGRSQSLPH